MLPLVSKVKTTDEGGCSTRSRYVSVGVTAAVYRTVPAPPRSNVTGTATAALSWMESLTPKEARAATTIDTVFWPGGTVKEYQSSSTSIWTRSTADCPAASDVAVSAVSPASRLSSMTTSAGGMSHS